MSEKLKSDPKGTFITTPRKMRPQVGKQKVYENAIKIVHHFVRVCEKHGKVKATEKYVKTLN